MNVRRLFLTYHHPAHDDAFLARIEEDARELAASLHSPLWASGREGYEETVANDAADARLTAGLPAPDAASSRPLRLADRG